MSSNLLAALALVLSSASWFTVHVALCWALWPRLPGRKRWLTLLPPTAWLVVFWGVANGLRFRAIAWAVCALTYVAVFVFAA